MKIKDGHNLLLAHSEERVEGGDNVRRRTVRGTSEVDVEHLDLTNTATKTIVVGDAEAINIGVDCGVLRKGCMPLATSWQIISGRQEQRRREGPPDDEALLTT